MSFFGAGPGECVCRVQPSAVTDLERTDLLAILNSYSMYEVEQGTIFIDIHSLHTAWAPEIWIDHDSAEKLYCPDVM